MMEAHKFCKTANKPTKTKCKNNYCESKSILHVYLRDILKMASKSFCTSNENTEEYPEPADEVNFQTEYSPD